VDVVVEVALAKARVVVSAADRAGDGLLTALMPGRGVEAQFDARIVWSKARGMHLAGSAGLEVSVPATAALGPLRLRQIGLAVAPTDSALGLAVTFSGDASLGPVTLGLDGVGIAATAARRPGNLGPLDLELAIRPPRGVSIAIDASPVSGRGALLLDPASGRYAGAIDVTIFELAAAAFGLLEPSTPGGGFSLVAAIGVRFPRIQLGLGFTLDGIGGFVGINRRVDVDRVRGALRSGGVAALFATDDPAERVPQLLRDLGSYFPAANGRHVVGPTAKLGWGTPQIIAADLALLVEAPAPIRVIVLGALRLGLPTLATPIVDLRLDVLGVLDPARATLAVDAALHDSSLAGYPLTGEMALRLGWGAQPQFLLSIGGFHPHFYPPAGFPVPRRLQLVVGDNPQLRLTGYLALTSNTAQIGARADVAFRGGGFEIAAHIGFDALFEFVPFHFEVGVTAGASIKWHSIRLLSVDLDFVLSGPRPWHAWGEATFGVLWWDVSVGFDETWGDRTPVPLPPAPDLAALLRDALGRTDAWVDELPAGERAWITLATTTGDGIRIHPFAALVVRQRVVPLDHDISQFNNVPLGGRRRFAITRVDIAGESTATVPVDDRFAPGQFTRMPVAQRLSAPAFEAFHSGVRIADTKATRGDTARAAMDATVVIADKLAPPPTDITRPVTVDIVATARPTRPQRPRRSGPRARDLEYVLASRDDLSITADGAHIAGGNVSYTGLQEALRRRFEETAAAPTAGDPAHPDHQSARACGGRDGGRQPSQHRLRRYQDRSRDDARGVCRGDPPHQGLPGVHRSRDQRRADARITSEHDDGRQPGVEDSS
jgi:hypothetical protein